MEASEIRQQPVTEELVSINCFEVPLSKHIIQAYGGKFLQTLPKQSLFSLRPSDGDEFHIQVSIYSRLPLA